VLAVGAAAPRGRARLLVAVLLVYDLAALAALCLLPAQPQVSFQRFVRRRFPSGFHGFVAGPRSPWVWKRHTMYFYGPPPPNLRAWPGARVMAAESVTRLNLVVSSWESLPPVAPYACRSLHRSVPEWLARGRWHSLPARLPVAWDLYRCTLGHHPRPEGP
jgi:hypothetical protein